ncbi:MAG: hypothetical protein LUH20_13135 [Lachnospiraceae bacterium]|nr:hypothetical protein [Lachnospiraceae bacterium]
MKKHKLMAMVLCMELAMAVSGSIYAEEATATEESNVLSAPTDFTIDPLTGEYSFTAVDENVGYYFIRVYKVKDGEESGDYIATSSRINGGSTGECTGTLDMSEIGWGTYHVNLVTFAAAGTDYEKPDAVTLTLEYGVGGTLERPEMMVMTSGNQMEVMIDWYTLADYVNCQYLPEVKISVYADAECTEEVLTDTVDTSVLLDTAELLPGGSYVWGFSESIGEHFYTIEGENDSKTFAFRYDVYTYNLDAGTYYVTCQALAKDEYTNDSQVSTVVEITLTDEESSSEYEYATTELWADMTVGMDRVYASSQVQTDRIDTADAQETVAEVIG